jgi:hypothetical protein
MLKDRIEELQAMIALRTDDHAEAMRLAHEASEAVIAETVKLKDAERRIIEDHAADPKKLGSNEETRKARIADMTYDERQELAKAEAKEREAKYLLQLAELRRKETSKGLTILQLLVQVETNAIAQLAIAGAPPQRLPEPNEPKKPDEGDRKEAPASEPAPAAKGAPAGPVFACGTTRDASGNRKHVQHSPAAEPEAPWAPSKETKDDLIDACKQHGITWSQMIELMIANEIGGGKLTKIASEAEFLRLRDELIPLEGARLRAEEGMPGPDQGAA